MLSGPAIDEAQLQTVLDYIEIGKKEAGAPKIGGNRLTGHPAGALRIANNIPFGLSASIQTTNLSRVFDFVYGMEAGLLTINLWSAGVEYQLPFGGSKESSFGPKEQGPAAIEFYSDYKTIYLKY